MEGRRAVAKGKGKAVGEASAAVAVVDGGTVEGAEVEGDGPSVVLEAGGKEVRVVAQDLKEIPPWVGANHGHMAERLDLSFNCIRDVASCNLEAFPLLNTLVLDNNELGSRQVFPHLRTLNTLWVNSNNIDDLTTFLDGVVEAFPNLTYLSLMKNPACPLFAPGRDEGDYRRLVVLFRIPRLSFLDSTPVSMAERAEAQSRGQFLAGVRPREDVVARQLREEGERQIDELSPEAEMGRARPLGQVREKLSPGGARIGVSRFVYVGRQSEGNRFILDSQL